jgi:hypothetical protein
VHQDGSRPVQGRIAVDDGSDKGGGSALLERAADDASNSPRVEAGPSDELAPQAAPSRVQAIEFVSVRRHPIAADGAALRRPSSIRTQVQLRPSGRTFFEAPRFNSPGLRFALLCLAAFFFSAGVVHSYTRWKPGRVIVVPATITPGAVIT